MELQTMQERSGTTDDGGSGGASLPVAVGRSDTLLGLQFQLPSHEGQDTTPRRRRFVQIRWGSILAVVLLVVLVIQNSVFFHLNRPQDIVKELRALVATLPNSIPDHNRTDLARHWAALQTALAELKAELKAELEADLEAGQTSLAELKAELKAGQEAGQTALAELKAGQTALAELKAELKEGQMALAELKAELKAGQTSLAELKAGQMALGELKAGQEAGQEALAELKAGQEAGQEALAELKEGQKEGQTALAELKAGQTEVAQLKVGQEAGQEALAQLKVGQEAGQTALAELKAGQEAGQTALRSNKGLLNQILKDLETDYKSMSQELSQEKKELHDVSGALSSLRQKVVDQPTLHRELLQGLMPRDCSDIKAAGKSTGVYLLFSGSNSFKAYCNMWQDGGGWTVIQRRRDDTVDFFRGWDDYREGFGDLTGGHWLGLRNIYALTFSGPYQLRIDFTTSDGRKYYARYDEFWVGWSLRDPEKDGYQLYVSGYSGDAGDRLSGHSGMKFSTKDRDQDTTAANCANLWKGAWWYEQCYWSSLNGLYKESGTCDGTNAIWRYLGGPEEPCLRFVEMKIRPRK
nr:fibrinogen C domain-containing protein 1-B-like isoform X12 [Syngnathus scovelli]